MAGSMTDDFGGTIVPSIRHLKLFENVATLQGLRRASEAFHLSQPAVTQAIAKLEEQVGVSLFERRARGSYLNEYGTIFSRRAKRFFVQLEEALNELGLQDDQNVLVSRITRSQIRSLVSIVENGSFAQAARALNVAQTSLRRAARDLEQNLGRSLYLRTAIGVIAAPAGAELARRFKLATREIELAMEEMQAAKGEQGGRILVGALSRVGSLVLPQILREFLAAHSDADIKVATGNSKSMLGNLRFGEVDFVVGLIRDPPPDDLVNEALFEAPYVIVGRKGHPLASKRKITRSDLTSYDWIVGTPGASRSVTYETLFADRRRPEARIETYSLPTIEALLACSDRLTLLTSFELNYVSDALGAIPFGPIEPVHSIGVTLRRNWIPTSLQSKFLDLIRKQINESAMRRAGAFS